jgi:uncharacterized protein YjbI with pentapeptide repeats
MTDTDSFRGDPQDLAQFRRLLASPIRSEQREAALHAWEAYKLARQAAYVRDAAAPGGRGPGVGKHGVWTKGDYVASLTAPAIDLRGGSFTDACVGYADLRGVRLDDSTFSPRQLPWTALKGCQLVAASLRRARLPQARLMEADLRRADLTAADLAGADLSGANLGGADLSGADLTGADLSHVNLVAATIEGARLDGARVYGVAAWDLRGDPASSRELVVTPGGAALTVDQVQVAQFLYLLLHNPEIRDVLDTVTRKVVLLLGRFAPARKAVLDALREALRERGLVPILFDFDQPTDRDITETVTLLARLARFVVADLTEPASIPQELQAIAPHVAVPIRLIVQEGHPPYSMSRDLRKYHWVLRPHRYRDLEHLLATLGPEVVGPAEAKRREIERERAADAW